MRKAAIDLGTVTSRLLIADVRPGSISVLVRRTIVTNLGRGVHASGVLSEDAIAAVTEACAGFAADIASHRVDDVVAVATSAARDAGNGRDLLGRLEALDIRPRVIAGAAEARLSFVGATWGLDDTDILVVDLGGGSTELVFGSVSTAAGDSAVEIEASRSIDMGSRRLLETHLTSDPPEPAQIDAAAAWVAEHTRPFFDSLRSRPRTMLALAGTATTLSAVRQRLDPYDPEVVHGSRLSGADISGLREDLAAMTVAQRREVVGMDPARADVIVAGAVILETVLGLSGLDSLVVSEHDILYGLLIEGI